MITKGPTPFDHDATVRMDGDVVADLEAVWRLSAERATQA